MSSPLPRVEKVYEVVNGIRCSVCGNPLNAKWFVGYATTEQEVRCALFICECWSGDPNKDMPRHIFEAKVKVSEAAAQ